MVSSDGDDGRELEAKSRFTGGGGDDESPARECGYASLAGAGASVNAVRRVDRSARAHVDGVDRDDGDVRVPELHENVRARGARSNASIPQKSLAKAQARIETAVLREAKIERARRR